MINLFKSISAVTFGILVIPFFVHAETRTTDLCTALRTLVANFSSPSAALVSSVDGMCPVATPYVAPSQKVVCIHARALTIGLSETMTHSQVKNLQIFLNNSGSPVSDSGDGSFGHETTYFGTKTTLAVQNWQARNGVVMSGTSLTTGYGSVGAQTRAKMVQVACGDTPVVAAKPSITTTSLPNGVLNTVYSANIVSVGGVGMRDWEITAGALPPGVYLNKLAFIQGGITVPVDQGQPATIGIYGTPTTAGTYTFTATVSIGELIVSKQFKIVIQSSTTATTRACTMDAKMCSDGSSVSRTGPNCSFAACPSGTSASSIVPFVDDVTEINPTNALPPIPGIKKSAEVVVELKVNNSVGPITVGREDSLNFTWSSNVPVTNCKRGSSFKNESAFTQNSGTGGTIPVEHARYTFTTAKKTAQEFNYTLSCSYRKEGQNYDIEKGDDVLVKVSPITTQPAVIDPLTY